MSLRALLKKFFCKDEFEYKKLKSVKESSIEAKKYIKKRSNAKFDKDFEYQLKRVKSTELQIINPQEM